ncbi:MULTISPECIES: transglycosylase SLT domain-containing protein [unclassified Pseudonocardia]|uniref:lytic transglycosylase domain-containing protein n=1 Tax=unclassified Pseudonocardia TaxID=2619320 RepID=UPI001CF66711|nr:MULTISPECIES: transglycosylase SLT domain-containing protein [unclassified Pseudonocardia]
MNQESSGDPNAINLWDSNARRGDPSIGLMQVIGSTYRAYADPRHNFGQRDPLSNILAGMRWSIKRYGSLAAGFNRKGGYRNGGWLAAVDGYQTIRTHGEPEAVLTPHQWSTASAALRQVHRDRATARDGRQSVRRTIQFGDIHVRETVDIDHMLNRASFLAARA